MKLFLLLTVFLRLNGICSPGIIQLIKQLNDGFETELNVFINFEDTSTEVLDLQVLETPAVHLQSTTETFYNFPLIGTFTTKSLIMLNLKNPPLDDAVVNILPNLLKDLHELNIVFYSENDPNKWQENLYRFCLQAGFINVLLIYYNNPIESLYSYNPYPTVTILELDGLKNYFKRLQSYQNFHNKTIRTFSDSHEPRKISYINRRGHLVRSGYIYNAFLEFYKRHNATLDFVAELPLLQYMPKLFEQLNNKDVDFASYPKEITWNFSSTVPLYPLKNYIMVPYARPLASYLYFARPFTWTLWIGVIVIVVYSSLMLYASYARFHRSEFGLQFLSSWCHLLFLPQAQVSILSWQQSIIHVILAVSGFVLTNLYLALLSSMLTLGLFEPQLNTLHDLKYSPYPLLLDDYYAELLKNVNNIPFEVKERMITTSTANLIKTRIGLNSSFMYSCYEDRMDGYLYQQHLLKIPRFKKIPESILDGLFAFPVAQSLPYLNKLNIYWRRIFEHGILSKLQSDAWMDAIDGGIYKLLRNVDAEQKAFDLDFYLLAFLLWTLGLTLASLCFLLEWLRWQMR